MYQKTLITLEANTDIGGGEGGGAGGGAQGRGEIFIKGQDLE